MRPGARSTDTSSLATTGPNRRVMLRSEIAGACMCRVCAAPVQLATFAPTSGPACRTAVACYTVRSRFPEEDPVTDLLLVFTTFATEDEAARVVLAIETSCDDTSVAVLERGARLRAHLIATQDVHRLYGGVVPELASRAHLDLLPALVERALVDAGLEAAELTAIAVTHAPGLVGSLVVGVAFAKALALGLGIPVVGVNHIEAHLHAGTLELGDSPFPAAALVVSGGHTELVEVRGVQQYRWLGTTLDDAAGEAYDKVAKLLGLGFPGGPPIDRLALTG